MINIELNGNIYKLNDILKIDNKVYKIIDLNLHNHVKLQFEDNCNLLEVILTKKQIEKLLKQKVK